MCPRDYTGSLCVDAQVVSTSLQLILFMQHGWAGSTHAIRPYRLTLAAFSSSARTRTINYCICSRNMPCRLCPQYTPLISSYCNNTQTDVTLIHLYFNTENMDGYRGCNLAALFYKHLFYSWCACVGEASWCQKIWEIKANSMGEALLPSCVSGMSGGDVLKICASTRSVACSLESGTGKNVHLLTSLVTLKQ